MSDVDVISKKTLQVPAFERDFKAGALYDARNEEMVIGYTLWDEDDLNMKAIRNDGTPLCSFSASNKLSETLNVHDVNAQLSILSGLIKFGASKEKRTEKKSSSQECSVQVRCLYKTAYKEMGMKQLMNIRYPDVARTGHNNSATHFVTRIQYGAGAIFTFKKEFQSTYEEERVKTELNFFGEKIKTIMINGSVRGNSTATNSFSYDRITCEFHSFGLSLNEALPTTYEEALKFAANFSRVARQSMAKDVNGEPIGVPCIVWLQPLVTLPGCANAPKLHCDFDFNQSVEFIRRWTNFLEDCVNIERDIEDMIQRSNRPFFSLLFLFKDDEQQKFKDDTLLIEKNLTELRCNSKKELKDMIVDVRSGLVSIDDFDQLTSWIIQDYQDESRSIKYSIRKMKEKYPGFLIT